MTSRTQSYEAGAVVDCLLPSGVELLALLLGHLWLEDGSTTMFVSINQSAENVLN